jgi:hypothetical protein
LQAAKPTSYSSYGIEIAILSPLTTGKGSCDAGISHTLLTASAKDFLAVEEGDDKEGAF